MTLRSLNTWNLYKPVRPIISGPMDRRFFLLILSSFAYILLYNGACYSFPTDQNCANNIDIRLINVESKSKDSLQDTCCLSYNDFNFIFQSNSRDSFLRLEACSSQEDGLPKRPFEPLLEFIRSRKEPPDECSTNFFQNINTLKWLYLERCEVNLSFVKNLLLSTRKLQILRFKKNKFRDISDENFRNQNQLLRLEITYNEIKYLANKTFYGLTNLERLILNHNRIGDIAPDSFSHLKNLKVLDLGYNKLKSLTPQIFSNNSNLEYLYVNGNHLTFLPENIFYSLTKLTKLFIQNNNIANMPETLFKSQIKLTELYMNQNDISRLPERIFAPLENILILNLAQNNFSLINDALIKHLKKLKKLDLSQNEILIFPNEVMNFTNLTTLSLKGNRIVKMPQNIFSDNALSFLDLDKNEIEDVLLNFEQIQHEVHVKINYNRRNISSIILNMDNETKHHITIELAGNHISCNAYLEYYNKFFIPLQKPVENITFKLIDGNYESRCYEPEFLKDRSIKDVSLTEAMQQLYGCSDKCDCYLRHWDGYKVVNCSYRNLDYFPKLNSVYQNSESEYTAPNSIELNMTGNLLTKVTEDDIPLDYNKEKVISNFKVYLSNNRIKEFTWVPKSNLEVITLDGNQLESLRPEVLESFKYLSNLTLFNNPWNCECSVALPLWNFLHDVKNVTLNDKIQCTTNWDLKEMTSEKLCSNNLLKIGLPSFLFILFLLSTLFCFLIYYWELIRAWLYHRRWLLPFIVIKDFDQDKEFDVFLSYSNLDADFVEDTLLPWLESDRINMKVCIHRRNFMPGAFITQQCVDRIHQSRRTLAVLSNDFLYSGWCLQEFRIAYQQGIEDKQNRLVVIKCGTIDEKLFTNEIKTYLKTITYVEREDKWLWEKLEYALPHKVKETKNKSSCKVIDVSDNINNADIHNVLEEKLDYDLPLNIIESKNEYVAEIMDTSYNVIKPDVESPLLDQNILKEIICTHKVQDLSNLDPCRYETTSPYYSPNQLNS